MDFASLITNGIEKTTANAAALPVKFLSAPEGWIITLIVLGVIALIGYFYYRETKEAATPWKIFLGVMRLIVFLIVLFMLFNPVPQPKEEDKFTRYSYAVVLLDSSFSMTLTDLYENEETAERLSDMTGIPLEEIPKTPRSEIVRKILASEKLEFLEKLRDKNNVRVYAFDKTIGSLGNLKHSGEEEQASADGENEGEKEDKGVELASYKAEGTFTSVGNAITEALNDLKAERIAGVVIITDGRSNYGIIEPEEAARRLKEAHIPLYTVGVGNPTMPKNIKLSNLKFKSEVREGDWINFDFMVDQQGYEGLTVKPRVTLNGEDVIDFKPEKYTLKKGGQQSSLTFKATKPGQYKVRIEVPRQDSEKDLTDNALEGALTVKKKEKIKVLYVAGQPRWEYRYLKTFLIRDTDTIEAQVLLQSADPKFIQESSPGVPPLLDFPARKELMEYNVVIFGDVDPDPDEPASVRFDISRDDMKNIREFVSKGGAFVMIAGENAAPQKYLGSPIEDILPVFIEKLEAGREFNWHLPKTKAFRPVLTEAGWNHVITRLDPDPEVNRNLWLNTDENEMTSLPGFYWYHPVREAKPGAIVLAEHPVARDKTRRHLKRVIFAAQYYGRGTTFFSAVDSTWRWRAGVGGRYFDRFWGQIIRFSGKTIRYTLSAKDKYNIFDTVEIHATAKDQNYNPETIDTLKVELERPGGEKESIVLKKERPGYYRGSTKASAPGIHRLTLVPPTGDVKEKIERTFTVVVPNDEKKLPFMNGELLTEMAALSAGEFVTLDEIMEVPDKIVPNHRTHLVKSSVKPLIDSPDFLWIVAALFVGFLTIEWIIRKRQRML